VGWTFKMVQLNCINATSREDDFSEFDEDGW